jgi:hypothetical protein
VGKPRAAEALDDVSDRLGEVLRRADGLLAEWSQFGAAVRAQVDDEARRIGHAVGAAVDGATARAASVSVERALTDQIGAKLAALAAEVNKLESRARAASRAIGEERRGDRRVLWGLAGGVALANALLVAVLLRAAPEPPSTPAPVPVAVPEAIRIAPTVELPSAAPPIDAGVVVDAVSPPMTPAPALRAPATSRPAPKPAGKRPVHPGGGR